MKTWLRRQHNFVLRAFRTRGPSMYMYIYIYIYIYSFLSLSISLSLYLSLYMYVYMYVYIYIYIYTSIYTYMPTDATGDRKHATLLPAGHAAAARRSDVRLRPTGCQAGSERAICAHACYLIIAAVSFSAVSLVELMPGESGTLRNARASSKCGVSNK